MDSRAVKPGDLFFALAGSKTDGSRFHRPGDLESAPSPWPAITSVGRAACRSWRRRIRAARWRWPPPDSIRASPRSSPPSPAPPARPRWHRFAREIWGRLGHPAASIGTIGLVSPKRTVYGSLTTPDPISLHRELDEITGEGVTHLALEASSHGLDQYRLDGVRVAAGGFTNLSRDHMDYHPDVAHYLGAKLRLFLDLVADDGVAVIAADHEHSGAGDRCRAVAPTCA